MRIISALILAAVSIALLLASAWTFAALVGLAGAIAAWEWGRLVRSSSFEAAFYLHSAAIIAIAFLTAAGRPELALLGIGAGAFAIAIAARPPSSRLWSVGGFLYTATAAFILVWLRSSETLGTAALLYLLAVTTTTDTVSYAAGRLIGGPKLAPRLSPKKTWSGLLAGTALPALVGVLFALILAKTSSPAMLAVQSVLIAAACQLGDLAESAAKRQFGAKDMSSLIPGHGGLLDRIDSLLAASLAAGLIALLRDPASPGQALLLW